MNPQAQELLASILKKNPEDLTKDEVSFLNARRTYLSNEQIRIFVSVLNEVPVILKSKPGPRAKTKYQEPTKEEMAKQLEKEPLDTVPFDDGGQADPDKV